MHNTDKLFDTIEELIRALKQAVKEKDSKYDLDGNMMLKFARYYYRHQDLDRLFALLDQKPEKRGKKYVVNWLAISKTLKEKKQKLESLNNEEKAYVLGWVAKRSRA